jgi:UDP-glucose 4-epimerase
MRNILVTGGAGFIGSHTVVELVNAGYNPVIIDNLSNSNKSVIDNIGRIVNRPIIFYKHNYQDESFLSKVIKNEKITGVIHFAAFKAVSDSVDHPLKYYDNNVCGLVNLLKVLEEQRIDDLVFSSSCTVYGEPEKLPITEKALIKPATSPYGATKQFCEKIISDCTVVSKSLRSISLRYFNPIGAHHSGYIGELPKGIPMNLVPFLTQAVAGLRPGLTVYGKDYPTADGTCVRDYIHVVDLAKAHVKALDFLASKSSGFYDVFNIGTGHGSSVLEIINTFEKVNNKKVPYKFGPRRQGDVISTYASTKKANEVLKWEAEKTLSEALFDAWQWQEKLAKAELN